MIVKGIVSKAELERIRAVLSEHGLTEGAPDGFRTWTEESEAGAAIWVEVDVNEELGVYLSRSGFFDTGEESPPVHEIKCPRCGNNDLEELVLRVEKPCYLSYRLVRDESGAIWGDDGLQDVEDGNETYSNFLYCYNCTHTFDNPGISLK